MASVTLQDVARAAGVSIATASRVLNGGGTRRVAEEYRERVMAAARELHYSPNVSAQAVVRGSTNLVTLVVPDISDPYFSTIAAGVARRASAAGMVVMMAVSERDPAKEAALVRSLRGQRPAVMILTGSRYADAQEHQELVEELTVYADSGGRVVFLGQDALPFPAVVLDNRAGAHDLATALVDQGYRRIGILGGQPHLLTAVDRVEGFIAGAAAAGVTIDPDHIQYGPFTRQGGYDAMVALAEHSLDEIDLVFAANDVMAVGALAALRENGVDVPGQLALAGYDDIHTAQDVYPPLTTVHIALDRVGELAVDLALNPATTGPVAVDSSVVLRTSTPRLTA